MFVKQDENDSKGICIYVYMCVHAYHIYTICMYVCMYMYIYIYIEREREREILCVFHVTFTNKANNELH